MDTPDFEYRRPEKLQEVERNLDLAEKLNEGGAPIKAMRALLTATTALFDWVDRRERIRQRKATLREEPKQRTNKDGRPPRIKPPAEEQLVELLRVGALSQVAQVTGAGRDLLKRIRKEHGLPHRSPGGSRSELRQMRSELEARWQAMQGAAPGPIDIASD